MKKMVSTGEFPEFTNISEPLAVRSKLTPKALKVLKLLGAGNIATEVGKTVPCAKSYVSRLASYFQTIEALKLKTGGVIKYYSMTQYGSQILTGSDKTGAETYVLEDHAVKFEIVEEETAHIAWEKLGSPRNWVKLGAKFGNVRVVKTCGKVKHIIIHPGRLKALGFDVSVVDSLLVDAGRIVELVKQILENHFGMILGLSGVRIGFGSPSLLQPILCLEHRSCRSLFWHDDIL